MESTQTTASPPPAGRLWSDALKRAGRVRADSGAMSLRHFCTRCGTHLYGRRDPDDGHYTIYAGTLDEPDRFEPGDAIFVRSRQAWDVSRLDLPEHRALP